jgi:ribonuclease D
VILKCRDSHLTSSRENAVAANPIAGPNTKWREISLPAKKKNRCELDGDNCSLIRATIAWRDRFARGKNSSNSNVVRFLVFWESRSEARGQHGTKTARTVTTSHLFWPNQRRKSVALLPISQPNSNSPGRQFTERADRGAEGVGTTHPPKRLHQLATSRDRAAAYLRRPEVSYS